MRRAVTAMDYADVRGYLDGPPVRILSTQTLLDMLGPHPPPAAKTAPGPDSPTEYRLDLYPPLPATGSPADIDVFCDWLDGWPQRQRQIAVVVAVEVLVAEVPRFTGYGSDFDRAGPEAVGLATYLARPAAWQLARPNAATEIFAGIHALFNQALSWGEWFDRTQRLVPRERPETAGDDDEPDVYFLSDFDLSDDDLRGLLVQMVMEAGDQADWWAAFLSRWWTGFRCRLAFADATTAFLE